MQESTTHLKQPAPGPVRERGFAHALAFLTLAAPFGVCSGHAQVAPTATQTLALSAFGGVTGIYTGLNGGRNLSASAGIDLEFPSHRLPSLQPAVEVRAMYPLDSGHVDGQKNILGGLRESWQYGRLRPYGDILVGAGRISYLHGLPDPARTYLYLHSSSLVISPGLGAEFRLGDRLALKADVQLQHYDTPVLSSGRLYATPITLGVAYRFDHNHLAGRWIP